MEIKLHEKDNDKPAGPKLYWQRPHASLFWWWPPLHLLTGRSLGLRRTTGNGNVKIILSRKKITWIVKEEVICCWTPGLWGFKVSWRPFWIVIPGGSFCNSWNKSQDELHCCKSTSHVTWDGEELCGSVPFWIEIPGGRLWRSCEGEEDCEVEEVEEEEEGKEEEELDAVGRLWERLLVKDGFRSRCCDA